MKGLFRTILAAALALFAAHAADAQVAELRTVDPVSDSIAIAKMRYKMERIRRERPTVALVLSGGGAKGAAHVGAIQFLEKVGIPVDMVLGTSMGGLVGGLYSMGYSPAQMDSLLRSLDWSVMLSDQIPSEYRSYQHRKYKEQYLFSIPFYYSQNALTSEGKPSKKTSPEEEERTLHLGANDEFADKTLKDNLFGSLPAGYIYGHNVNKLFSQLTAGYQDDIDFCDLPLPFFCIASDLVTGKAMLWHEGKLNTALRSTMSIPGIFAPVRENGMVLVDGGIRNNYPTDVAKAMGADIVIGVELSDAVMEYSDIYNIGDMVWKVIDILGMDSFDKNVNIPDVTIKPNLEGYNMMSFDPASIDIIISRGYEAAYDKADELFAIKDKIGRAELTLQNKPATDVGKEDIMISEVTFEGLTPTDKRYLSDKIAIKAGDTVTKADIEAAIATLYGTQSFDYVTYELLGTGQPFVLNLKCKKGPVHQVGVGARFDTESLVSLLINAGFNVHKVQGSSWDFTTRASASPYFNLHYAYKTPKFPTINIDVKEAYTNANVYELKNSHMNLAYWNISQQLYLSDLNWMKANIKAGIRNEYVNVKSLLVEGDMPNKFDKDMLKNDYISVFFDAIRDTYDDGYFPKKGFKGALYYRYVFNGIKEGFEPNHSVQAEASGVLRLSDYFHIIPSIYTRFVFGNSVSLAHANFVGGNIGGRYIEQQLPFVGISCCAPVSAKVGIARADFRLHLTKNNYLTTTVNVMKTSDTISKELLWAGDTTIGAGLEYGYDSILGPIKLNVNWSNFTEAVGAYVSIGFDF